MYPQTLVGKRFVKRGAAFVQRAAQPLSSIATCVDAMGEQMFPAAARAQQRSRPTLLAC